MQIINISSTLGSIGTLQGSLGAEEGSFPAKLSHYHLAYRSSKAALNMRKPPTQMPCMADRGESSKSDCTSHALMRAALAPLVCSAQTPQWNKVLY